MAEKEASIVSKGHDDGIKFDLALVEEFGLLPLADVVEVGFARVTGFMWILKTPEEDGGAQLLDGK